MAVYMSGGRYLYVYILTLLDMKEITFLITPHTLKNIYVFHQNSNPSLIYSDMHATRAPATVR